MLQKLPHSKFRWMPEREAAWRDGGGQTRLLQKLPFVKQSNDYLEEVKMKG